MTVYSASSKAAALLLFVDIVDSSVHSSFLGIEKFAEKVLRFQEVFHDLGHKYFYNKSYFNDKIDSLCNVDTRGDEGSVFVIDPRQEGAELISRAVKFTLELKARLKILLTLKEEDLPPKEMKLAAGIHYGEVALITSSEEKEGVYRKLIDRIMGYSINYAKRVESSSRIGGFSQVFLSKEAASLLSYSPIVLYKHESPLKGIGSREEVYEVRSTFLEELPASEADGVGGISNKEFIDYFIRNVNEFEFLREPWLKSFVLSILSSQQVANRGTPLEKDYFDKISKVAWCKPIEDDPIMLYWRARECETLGKYSRSVSYLKDILAKYPYFIHARIKIIDACFKMVKSEHKMSPDLVFVRDTAEEMLEKYKELLSAEEKDRIQQILKQIPSANC
jgi:class 3 adenylate cyclase